MLIVVTSGCGTIPVNNTNKIKIIATLFPQYDFTKQIVGEKAEVTLLLPPGVESHTYEPTPADIIKINSAKMFVYTGDNMESWAKKIVNSLENKSITVVDVSKNVVLSKPNHTDEHQADEHSNNFDPHIWTSPKNAIIIVDNILSEIKKLDPKNADFYQKNADEYKQKLNKLDNEFKSIAQQSSKKEIYFGTKNAFHYFLNQYNLTGYSCFDGCSSQTQPSVKTVADLISSIKKNKISVLFYDPLSNNQLSKSISIQTNTKLVPFYSCHNVSKTQLEQNTTYLELMKKNKENLKTALK